jgi:molybdopterin-guanine dinucleotide biosynthesis protein A
VSAEEVTAAILVGGRARRLGGKIKPTLSVGHQSILDRQLDALNRAGIQRILVVGHWHGPPAPAGRHVPDVVETSSALAGLYSALLWATTPVVLALAGDLPFVSPPLLRQLTTIDGAFDAVVPRTVEGWHPLCAAYRRGVAIPIKARLARGALRITEALADMTVREVTTDDLARLDPDSMLLMNVNTPADLQRAEDYIRTRS